MSGFVLDGIRTSICYFDLRKKKQEKKKARCHNIRRQKRMLDIKFLRENPDVVKQNIKNKFQDDSFL